MRLLFPVAERMRWLSRVIKAAQLKVLLTSPDQVVFRSEVEGDPSNSELEERSGTIVEAAELLDNAKDEATRIIEQAKSEAEEIISGAKSQAKEIENAAKISIKQQEEIVFMQSKEKGWQAGYEEGLKTSKHEVKEETNHLLTTLQIAIEEAVTQRSNSLAQLERDLLKLSCFLAEKIIKERINQEPTWLRPIIEQALQRLGMAEEITIRLHPKDYEGLEAATQLGYNTKATFNWKPDPSLSPRTCFIETEYGAIDGSIDHRLENLRVSLEEVVYSDE